MGPSLDFHGKPFAYGLAVFSRPWQVVNLSGGLCQQAWRRFHSSNLRRFYFFVGKDVKRKRIQYMQPVTSAALPSRRLPARPWLHSRTSALRWCSCPGFSWP